MELVNTALTLKDLPPSPEGKTGWPWTEETEPFPEKTPDGSEWPRISILTPSYNYGQFIEETIRSVLLQGYPNIEYIIIDGESTDNTVDIIQKYEQHINYWVSEPDQGQTDAINKGYQHCTGDLFVWLNADDLYYSPFTLMKIANLYLSGYDFIAGECFNIDVDGNYIFFADDGKSSPTNFKKSLRYWSSGFLQQPAVFVSKKLADRCFPLDTELYYVMDIQFFLRVLSQKPKAIWIEENLVRFRCHKDSKTRAESIPSNTQNLDEEPEFHKVVLAESKKLPTWWERAHFKVEAFDYLCLQRLIHRSTDLKLSEVLKQLIYRPTIVSFPLFWKVLFKAILGKGFYAHLRNFFSKD